MVRTGYSAVSRLASSLLGLCCKDVSMASESIEVTVLPVPVESMLYFYGSVSRETAEWILWDRGCKDGMFLLRESGADYVLSLCYQKSVLHYRIRKLSSGEVGLCGVPRQRFAGPVELVAGVEGLACKPTLPCNRSLDSPLPPTHWGVSEGAVREAVRTKAKEWGIADDDEGPAEGQSSDAHQLIGKTLHEIQPWFHGPLSRVEAERSIEESGHKDGKFLIRERDDSSYALCLSHSSRIKHYKIDVLPSGEFAIQDGQRFPSITALVSHYTLFSDGLWCSLQDPCVVPSRRSRPDPDSRQSGSLERDKPPVVRAAGSPPSRAQRLLHSLNQRRLFSRLFSSVAPQFAQTLPQKSRRGGPSPASRRRLYPSLSDDNLEGPRTPPARKPSEGGGGKPGNMQKASSFDFLPAFLSLFIYGDGATTTAEDDDDALRPHCNGAAVHCAPRSAVTLDSRCRRSTPVPAPRPSLAKKLCRQASGPVYANREALATAGRSASFGENGSAEDGSPRNGQPFCRSASSPSVVSQRTLPTLSRLSSSEGSAPAGLLLDAPVPKPRKMLPPWEGGRTETSCESCASTGDSSSSPTLTEISEFGPESLLGEDAFHDDLDRELPPEQPLSTERCSRNTSPLDCKLRSDDKINCEFSVYATLSGGDVIRLLNSPAAPVLPPPSSTTPAGEGTHCPEGVLVDLSESPLPPISREDSEAAYLTLRQCRRGPTLNLDHKAVELKERISSGVFCDVFKGGFSSGPVEVHFAVKKLKSSSVPNPKSEILKEAQTMVALDHPHIVRLIGVSDTTAFMLVMELAPLGPIHRYLRANKEVSPCQILRLMVQVASAMEYLEGRQFVHRDLAARNVLLVNENFAKISDFGMSRALGLGKEYYRAECAGKWPLKWYAPECIYYFKFSSKSDVWSYGVTLWESFSYGERPYQGLTGREILHMFENEERLQQPDKCPDSVYALMRRCWQYEAEDRPSFSAVHELLRRAADPL